MFKVMCQCVGIVGCWAGMAWLSLFLLSLAGVEVSDSSVTGILAVAVVAIVTSLIMEIRDWLRFNRVIVVEKKGLRRCDDPLG